MAVPLLDLKAQHATIRDSVVNAMTKVIDDQAFILGEPVERLEREVALLSHTTHAIGCANGTDAILLVSPRARHRSRRRSSDHAVHFFRHRGRRSQRRRPPGLRGHRSRHLQHLDRGRRGRDQAIDESSHRGGSVRSDGADRSDNGCRRQSSRHRGRGAVDRSAPEDR